MSPPVRVLELRSTYGGGGGPDKTILLSAARHDPRRIRVRCLYLRGAQDPAWTIRARAEALEVDYLEVCEQGRLDPVALQALLREVRTFRPQIVHAHDYKTDVLALLLAPLVPGLRLLSTAHGWTLDNAAMSRYTRLDQAALRAFDRVVAVSMDTRDRLVKAGLDAERLELLYNGIALDAWPLADREAARAALVTRLKLPETARLVGVIGRLSPEKDVPTALAVLERVLEPRAMLHALFIGDGAGLSDLKDRVAGSRLASRIHVLGAQPVGPELYHGLAAYLMTSLTEGLPNTLLEALCTATPAVATRVGGIPELVGESDAVLLSAPGDVAGLASALSVLLDDPQAAQQRAARGRTRIETAFSFDVRLERISRVYEELAAQPPPGPVNRLLRLTRAGLNAGSQPARS